MYLKILLTLIVVGVTALIAAQNMAFVQIKFFSQRISLSFATVIFCFLIGGFLIGLMWRSRFRFHRGKEKVALIQSDMRICK